MLVTISDKHCNHIFDLAALVGHRVDAVEGGLDLGREVLVGRLQRGDVVLQAEHVGLGVVGLVAQGGHLFSKLVIRSYPLCHKVLKMSTLSSYFKDIDVANLVPGGAATCSERFCNMFSESSPGCWAVLQLHCCPSKQGELSKKLLQNLGNKWPPHVVEEI